MLFVEIITVLFSVALAWLNKVPCIKMINCGASIKEEKQFHVANALVRTVWTITLCVLCGLPLYDIFLLFTVLLLIMWLVFDIALNVFIGHKWYYIGTTAKTDRWLIEHYSEDAGKIKAVIVFCLIVIINFFS